MSQLPWLPKYSGETTSELIALERTFRKDSIVAAFYEALDQKSFRIGGIEHLTSEERVVLAVEELQAQVNNGGYDQFFLNTRSRGERVTQVVSALERIGRSDLGRLTQLAVDIAASRARGDLLGAAALDALRQCDSEYFWVAGDLAEPLFEFIKQVQEHIQLP